MSDPHVHHTPKICAICGRVLDFFSFELGTGQYAHARQVFRDQEDHVPMPIDPPSDDEIVSVCDFCDVGLDPVDHWTVVTHPFLANAMGTAMNMSSLWAACAGCAADVQARNWDGIHDRHAEQYGPLKPALREWLRHLHQLVETNFILVRRPIGDELLNDNDFAPDPRET